MKATAKRISLKSKKDRNLVHQYALQFEIRNRILDRADTLLLQPNQGQKEPYLEHLNLDYRRIIESHYKIIYRVVGETIYITDVFDSRQDPDKMKG